MKRKHTLQLRQKILLVFAVTWIVAITIIGVVTIRGQIAEKRHSEIEKNAVALNTCKSVTQGNTDAINLIAMEFSLNDYVSLMMSSDFTDLDKDLQNHIINSVNMSIYTNSYRKVFKTGLSIAFFCPDGRVYANSNYSISRVDDDPEDESIIGYPEMKEGVNYEIKGNNIFDSGADGINAVYLRKFEVGKDKSEEGIIALAIPEAFLKDGFSTVRNREWAVLDRDNIIIESRTSENIGKAASEFCGYDLQLHDYSIANGSMNTEESDIVSYSHDEKNNLTYLIVTPSETIIGSFGQYFGTMIFIFIGIAIVLLILSWYLSKRFTQPLDKLQHIMKQAEEGNLNVRVNPESDDEIGVIGASFDNMIARLSDSIDNIQRVEQENRRAEMKIMELQLKPHFLYNTLSSIIWLANADRIKEVMDITKSLALFYRIALSEGREEIPALDEVGNVRNYANIQHYRYQDKFKVTYDIDHEIDACMVPKLILQPLVENSINYGMKPKSGNNGLITVKGYIENGEVIFEVIDNGDEADEESLHILNRKLETNTSGIGTGNVYGRIHHYGEQYKLVYERRGSYTVARINLPLRKAETDESFNS